MKSRHVLHRSPIRMLYRAIYEPALRRRNMSSLQHSPLLNRPVRLILDFDGTLTRKDTMHLIARAGHACQEELKRKPRPWNEIVNAYMTDFKRQVDHYQPQPESRMSLEDELAWLDSLKEVEHASIARALESGLFDQVRSSHMEQAVSSAFQDGTLQLRDGWLDLLFDVRAHNENFQVSSEIAVLSVNWSQELIRQTLSQSTDDSLAVSWLSCLPIYANELPSIVESNTNQSRVQQHQDIRTSGDKATVLKRLIGRKADAFSIYVGDSSTDLECLTIADIGICIRDEPLGSGQKELAATCERISLHVDSITASGPLTVFQDRARPCVLWAADFSSIQNWLFGSSVGA